MRFNQSVICGRLVRDAELKYAASGTAILSMRIAWDQGTKEEKSAGFIDVTMFGDRAAKIVEWCKKGREILASGRLQYREWDDKSGGGKRSALEIVAFDIEFTQPAQQGEGQQSQPQEGSFNKPTGAGAPPPQGAW